MAMNFVKRENDAITLRSGEGVSFIESAFLKSEQKKGRTHSHIQEIEKELEDVLLNTILNHEVFVRYIPLNINITVSKKTKPEIEKHSKEISVNLNFDPEITIEEGGKRNFKQDSEENNVVLESHEEYVEHLKISVPTNTPDKSEQRRKDSDTQLGTHVNVAASCSDTPDNVKKKFTLDQDKEILEIVVGLLPGRSLASLELSEDVLDFLSNKFARSPSSINQRWKYSLRTWLVQFFSKNHKSWSKNLSVKASVERRKQVVKYFNKLVKKNTLKIEVMNVTKIS